MKPAPIIIPVYTRLLHFKKCIQALQMNKLAPASSLFIYSDAASMPEHIDDVEEVRQYARSIKGFRSVEVIERAVNCGRKQNIHGAISDYISSDTPVILLEDDIVAAPGFLQFMNEALEYYKSDHRVLSISGYAPPIDIPADYIGDIFCMARLCGWGIGIYEHTFEALKKDIDINEYNSIVDKSILTKFGSDIPLMIDKLITGEIDAGDVRCMYKQALTNQMTIYPRKSLVQNIGHDGTGVHCGNSTKFHHNELWAKIDCFKFNKELEVDERIRLSNAEFRKY